MVTFEEIGEWLSNGGFQVIKEDEEIREYIRKAKTSRTQLLMKVDVPNTELSFRVHYAENSEVIDIRSSRYFSEQDSKFFSELSKSRQEGFYSEVKTVVFPFGLNVVVFPKEYQVHFAKTIFLEGLTKQYFFDSVFDFIHALELTTIAYENLSGSVQNPEDMA